MTQIKLQNLLKLLSKEEFSRFGKFLRSPFFNNTKSFLLFYEVLKKQYPIFEEKRWNPQKIWSKVFPNKSYADQKYWRLCSDLSLLLEKYLIQLELEHLEGATNRLLIQSYSRRNAYTFFEKENNKRINYLEALPYRDAEYFGELSKLNFDYYFHVQTQKHTLKDEKLENLMVEIDRHFVLSKLRLSSEFKNRERILKKQYDLHFLEEILKKGSEGFMANNAVFQLYQRLFLLYKNPEVEANFS